MGIDIAAYRREKQARDKKAHRRSFKQNAAENVKTYRQIKPNSYIKQNLLKDEQITKWGDIHWFIFVPGILFIVFGIISVFYAPPEISIFLIIAIPFGIVKIIEAIIYKWTTELAVTTRRVVSKTGFIRRDTMELNHKKVESISVNQSIIGRMLNFGTIIVNGTGGGKTVIPAIVDPLQFRRQATKIIDHEQRTGAK